VGYEKQTPKSSPERALDAMIIRKPSMWFTRWNAVVLAGILLLVTLVELPENRAFAQPSGKIASPKESQAEKKQALPKAHKKLPVVTLDEKINPTAIRAACKRGIDFLLEDQNKNGSWGSPTRTKGLNIYAPVPGAHHAFGIATTSLCICALIEWEADFPENTAAINRAEEWLIERLPYLRRADQTAIYNVWGHAYSLQALARMYRRHQDDEAFQSRLKELIEQQFDMLTRYESVDGGWGYYDFRHGTKRPASSSISFVGATVLVAFHEVQQLGFEPPPKVTQRALVAIHRQQKNDFSYFYGEYLKNKPMHPVNRPGGSLGRSQACNVALRMWGSKEITDQVIETWLKRLVTRNGWLDIGRKRPIPHESWFAVAGYFYYYGHFYAALCIEEIPAASRAPYQAAIAKLMLDRQEKDGSWWDYPLYDYHQPYGTSFALMTLKRCLPEKNIQK